MDYQRVEEKIKADYRRITLRYRQDDEIEVTTENHRRLATILKWLCRSLEGPITVLDAGCGTGRYFHCLENVERLIGLDICDEMLAAAQHPVCSRLVSADRIELARQNIFLANFAPASFDLIYSLGMFGNGCPVTADICDRFHTWLKPGGKLFFDAIDFSGLPFHGRLRIRTRALIYPWLPSRWRARLDERARSTPFYSFTKTELHQVMRKTCFGNASITSVRCESPLWNGRHLECLATKWVENACREEFHGN